MINRDVPQEVVRRILDHDSPQMTAHYARLHDTTVRRHWEAARKVDITGQVVAIDPAGPLAEAAWAKQRLGRATQALPNGFCGLPVQKTCPHANACLTCPMFLTTAEFLPQHRTHRGQVIELITAAEARGQTRLAEMNQQVLGNLDRIIDTLDNDGPATTRRCPMRADNSHHLIDAARRRAQATRRRAVAALRRMDTSGHARHLRRPRPRGRRVPIMDLQPTRPPRRGRSGSATGRAPPRAARPRPPARLRRLPAAPPRGRHPTHP